MAYNPFIVVPFATWAVAQISKFAIAAFKGRLDLRYLYASGGMPSVHSAVVCSLATTAFLIEGANSPVFGLAAVFAAVVMYDSFGVRRSSGEQAAAINMLVASLDKGKVRLAQPHLHLREILGHQPREVVIGAVVGVALAGLFNYDRLGALSAFVQILPKGVELWSYAGIFLVILLGGIVQSVLYRRRYKKSPTVRKLTKRIFVATQTTGWIGLIFVALEYERASYLAWRLWAIMVAIIAVGWGLAILAQNVRAVPAAIALEADEARKRKWLGFGGRKSKRG